MLLSTRCIEIRRLRLGMGYYGQVSAERIQI